MSILRSVESTIANLVEGVFGRIFPAEVRPMELARKLAREMDENRTVSVSRVYAPNEFAIWLSPQDRARYEGVEDEVIDELCAYLLEHARREELIMAGQPEITFHTDQRLALGEFGIQARSRSAAHGGRAHHPEPARPKPVEEGGQTMIYSPPAREGAPARQAPAPQPPRALFVVGGRRLPVPAGGGTIGRSHDCDIVVEDLGVSRRHARVRPSGEGWTVEDLGSTNGLRVNGKGVRGTRLLRAGDRVELGSSEIVFEVG
jgi:hypothetical protein